MVHSWWEVLFLAERMFIVGYAHFDAHFPMHPDLHRVAFLCRFVQWIPQEKLFIRNLIGMLTSTTCTSAGIRTTVFCTCSL